MKVAPSLFNPCRVVLACPRSPSINTRVLMSFAMDQPIKINKMTKYWQFLLDNRNKYEKEAGRYLSLEELKSRADVDWPNLSPEEKKEYHLKAKQSNQEAKRKGLRFKKKPAWVKHRDGILRGALGEAEKDEELKPLLEEEEEGEEGPCVHIHLHLHMQ